VNQESFRYYIKLNSLCKHYLLELCLHKESLTMSPPSHTGLYSIKVLYLLNKKGFGDRSLMLGPNPLRSIERV